MTTVEQFDFDDTIPAANNNPSNDQPIMLANNVADQGIWGVDHVGFNVPNGGMHNWSTYVDQGMDPPTGANQFLVYNNGNKLFARAQNNGTPFPLAGTFNNSTDGFIEFFGGITFQWGTTTFTVPGSGQQVVTFPVAFSGTAYSVVCTLNTQPTNVASEGFGAVSITNVGFTARNFNSGVNAGTFTWIAIGPS